MLQNILCYFVPNVDRYLNRYLHKKGHIGDKYMKNKKDFLGMPITSILLHYKQNSKLAISYLFLVIKMKFF